MLYISTFNLGKLIHSIMQNLDYRRLEKQHFLTYMDKMYKVQNIQLNIYNKIKDIYENNLDCSSPHDIKNFIEKYTNILDKSIYTKNIPVPASYLQNINTKIIQKMNEIQSKKGILENKHKLSNIRKKNVRGKRYQGLLHNKYIVKNTNTKQHNNFITNNLKQNNQNKSNGLKCNLTDNMVRYMEYEIELNNKALQLCTKDKNFIKRHVHISLYIANEEKDSINFETIDKKYKQVSLLCKQAILCLIEPSKKADIVFTHNLSATIQSLLSKGCRYHFESQRYNGMMVSEEIVEGNKKSQPIFKNPTFHQKFRPISNTGKKRTWRSLKQVLAQERSLPWPVEVVHYSAINAPPSFKPAKKYSDISGLPARYTDPQTKLYYATAEEFATVRSLPMDITAGYLALRGASSIVG